MIAHSILLFKYFSEVLEMEWFFFFEKSNLGNAGLRIQLGHGGATCISPKQGPLAFTVVDVSGIHFITIDFCKCQ